MIFAATVEHAKEVYGLLPKGEAALVSAGTPPAERDALITAFKQQQLRYLVNVAVLTTGFDAPHVDLIAILRPTESVSLYQQIVGRGLRLSPGKEDCLILDYAGNPITFSLRKWVPANPTVIASQCRSFARTAALPISSGGNALSPARLLNTMAAAARAGLKMIKVRKHNVITASASNPAHIVVQKMILLLAAAISVRRFWSIPMTCLKLR